jgi:hypothetical protein
MNTVTDTTTEIITDTVVENWRDSWVIEFTPSPKPDGEPPKDHRTWVEYFDKMWNISVIFGVSSIIYFYISRTRAFSTSKF